MGRRAGAGGTAWCWGRPSHLRRRTVGALFCWGQDQWGKLGTLQSSLTPVVPP